MASKIVLGLIINFNKKLKYKFQDNDFYQTYTIMQVKNSTVQCNKILKLINIFNIATVSIIIKLLYVLFIIF